MPVVLFCLLGKLWWELLKSQHAKNSSVWLRERNYPIAFSPTPSHTLWVSFSSSTTAIWHSEQNARRTWNIKESKLCCLMFCSLFAYDICSILSLQNVTVAFFKDTMSCVFHNTFYFNKAGIFFYSIGVLPAFASNTNNIFVNLDVKNAIKLIYVH